MARVIQNEEKKIQEQQVPAGIDTVPAQTALPSFDSAAQQKRSALYEQIASRGPFRYDVSKDPLYGMAKDRAVQQGRMAMKDTMGQAAALTGGYGSSYGQAVGQQAYDRSLQGLADAIPELYQAAYNRYKDQGDALQKQYAMLSDQEEQDYSRFRDAMGDWQYERAWQQQREDTDYERAREQEDVAYGRQSDAYSRLLSLIGSSGYTPTEEELAAAGMTAQQAEALRKMWQTGNPQAAYATGQIDPETYFRLTGQYPAGYQEPDSGGSVYFAPTKKEKKAATGTDTVDPRLKRKSGANISALTASLGQSRNPGKDLDIILTKYGGSLSDADKRKLAEAYEHATQTGKYQKK